MVGVDQDAVSRIDDALNTLVRRTQGPRAQEQLSARAGLSLERAAYPLLRRIGEGETVRASDVAAALSVDVSTVSRQVKELELDGLVARRPDPTDGRASILVLTAAGHQALERLRRARREVLAEVVATWPEEDRSTLADLICRLADDMVAHQGHG
ncbi:MAG TPA: MarR family winged helix-turn-helix transcriptional regulator [Acidimicrobiales bacterium]|nr:MarR family winged helix-turn-helix transcriptional regulator [Acidimicrobiales bacterium]